MIDLKTIERLAELSRINISQEEKTKFLNDLESILNYVDQIKSVIGEVNMKTLEAEDEKVNVLREDDSFHPPGQFTENLLACAPEKEDKYIKVKKIL